jgi:hypothetical protein
MTMTKEQAIEAIHRAQVPEDWDMTTNSKFRQNRIYAERAVNGYIALGMFVPAEPKTVEQEAVAALEANRPPGWGSVIIRDLASAGFKIVKA